MSAMNSLRRVAVRAVQSPVWRTASPRISSRFLSLANPTARKTDIAAARAVNDARFFSLSPRVANADEKPMEPAGETATKSAGEDALTSSADAAPDNSVETPYAVFIRNIVFDANEQHVREAFEKYGTITRTAIARDSRGLSKGFGFVWFTDAEAVGRALAEADGSFWHGRRLQVSPRTGKKDTGRGAGQGQPTETLYIGNIPYETTDAELNELFRDLNGVADVRVAVDRTTGWPRGFAHVDFETVEHCKAAHDKLQHRSLGGRDLRFDYARNNPKPSRKGPVTAEQEGETFL